KHNVRPNGIDDRVVSIGPAAQSAGRVSLKTWKPLRMIPELLARQHQFIGKTGCPERIVPGYIADNLPQIFLGVTREAQTHHDTYFSASSATSSLNTAKTSSAGIVLPASISSSPAWIIASISRSLASRSCTNRTPSRKTSLLKL